MNYRKFSRRHFLQLSLGITGSLLRGTSRSSVHVTPSRVIAGAIRWDAWYDRKDASIAAQYALSTPRYFNRAPFYCSIGRKAEVHCTGTMDEMNNEILMAARGGLKYWAFDWYPSNSSLHAAWVLYQNSPARHLINWCGVVGLDALGSMPFRENKWKDNMQTWADYMVQPHYQTVNIEDTERPLFYILWNSSQLKWHFDNDIRNVTECLNYLRTLLAEHGVASPYIVILNGLDGALFVRTIGADAISSYVAGHKGEIRGPYADLDLAAREFWSNMARTGVPTIPIVQVGWDTRPRQERPVPWEHKAANPNPSRYFKLPTPPELATHVKAAVDFIETHPTSCAAKALLIYSWNECDEGGGLIPTIGDPKGSYLSAIAPLIA